MSQHEARSSDGGVGNLDKFLGVGSAVLGQAPWIATVSGIYSFSLYQPAIYRGKELFLLIPLMVGLFSTWCVVRWHQAMWVVLVLFIMLCIFVYWAYETYPPLSAIHPINWVLSYCAFALFVAVLLRATMDVLHSRR